MEVAHRKLARITYLSNMICKYRHRWNEYPSARLMGWVDELDDLIADMRRYDSAWKAYCAREGIDPSCTARDSLA